jgi:hypothetical protein
VGIEETTKVRSFQKGRTSGRRSRTSDFGFRAYLGFSYSFCTTPCLLVNKPCAVVQRSIHVTTTKHPGGMELRQRHGKRTLISQSRCKILALLQSRSAYQRLASIIKEKKEKAASNLNSKTQCKVFAFEVSAMQCFTPVA